MTGWALHKGHDGSWLFLVASVPAGLVFHLLDPGRLPRSKSRILHKRHNCPCLQHLHQQPLTCSLSNVAAPPAGGLPGFKDDSKSCGALAAAPFGSALILPISFAYISMMGSDGLTDVSYQQLSKLLHIYLCVSSPSVQPLVLVSQRKPPRHNLLWRQPNNHVAPLARAQDMTGMR